VKTLVRLTGAQPFSAFKAQIDRFLAEQPKPHPEKTPEKPKPGAEKTPEKPK
jgi:hypothetical protein